MTRAKRCMLLACAADPRIAEFAVSSGTIYFPGCRRCQRYCGGCGVCPKTDPAGVEHIVDSINEVWHSQIHGSLDGWPGSSPGEITDFAPVCRVSCWRPACLCTAWHDFRFTPSITQQDRLCQALISCCTLLPTSFGPRMPETQSPSDSAHAMQHRYALCIACAAWAHTGSKKLHVFAPASTEGLTGHDGRGPANSHAADAAAMSPKRLEPALCASSVPVRSVLLRGRL